MSANNELIVLKNKKGEFEVHENFCVDNEFTPSKKNALTIEKCLIDAIKFANKYCRENIVEYGYHIGDSCLKENK